MIGKTLYDDDNEARLEAIKKIFGPMLGCFGGGGGEREKGV